MSKSEELKDSDDSVKKLFDDFRLNFGYSINKVEISNSDDIKINDLTKPIDRLIEKDRITKLTEKHAEIYDFVKKERRGKLPYLNSNSPDIVEQIKAEYKENKSVIILDDIMPLVDNLSFIDLIVEKKIPFKSILNKRFSESLSTTLLYLSNKKSLGKGGNPYVGQKASNLADKFAVEMGPIIDDLNENGFNSLKEKADELNKRKIQTHRGSVWTKTAISRVSKRWDDLKPKDNQSHIPPKP